MTKKSKSRGVPVAPTIAMLIAVAVLSALGVWQLERLQWKSKIMASLDEAYAGNPAEHALGYNDFIRADRDGTLFLRGRVTGHFLNQAQMDVGPRTHEGVPGYHVYVPLALDGGGTVLVNRGWVPEDKKDPARRPGTDPDGTVSVTGLARHPDPGNWFTPENDPAHDTWYRVDLPAMAKAAGVDELAPYVLYQEIRPGAPRAYPIPQEEGWRPPNNHLSYMLFWFSMAGLTILFYWMRFIKKSK